MRLVNSLVLGLLVQRGITQTDIPSDTPDDLASVEPTVVDQPTIIDEPTVEPIAEPTLDGRTIEEPTVVDEPTVVEEPTVVDEPTIVDEPTAVDQDPGTQETTFQEANPGFLATTAGESPVETNVETSSFVEPPLIDPSGTPTDTSENSPTESIAQGSIAGTTVDPEPTPTGLKNDDSPGTADETADGTGTDVVDDTNGLATATGSPSPTDGDDDNQVSPSPVDDPVTVSKDPVPTTRALDSTTEDPRLVATASNEAPLTTADKTTVKDSDETTAAPTAEATADEDNDGTTAAIPDPDPTTAEKPESTADTVKEPEKTTIETRVTGTKAAGSSTTKASATSAVDPVELKLTDATVDENCVITEEKGKPAIKMSPPPNGEAAFSLEAKTSDDDVPPAGTRVRVKASIRVRNLLDAGSRLETGQETNCSFKMFVDGANVYDRGLAMTGDEFEDITSNDLVSSENPKVDMKQECGDNPVELTVNGATLTGPRNAGSKVDDDSGSETETAVTVPTSSGTASDSSGDDENDAGISVVNKVVVCALSFVAVVIPVFL